MHKTEDNLNIENVAYEPDAEAGENLGPQFDEPTYAELNQSERVPIDANYQSLIVEDHQKEQQGNSTEDVKNLGYGADTKALTNHNFEFEESGYTPLNNSKRDRVREDYQSLFTEGYELVDEDPNRDVGVNASMKEKSNPGNEVLYLDVY